MIGKIVHHILKSIDPIVAPGLLPLLASMGHSDDLMAVDANHPATRDSARSA
ncbi:RbsD/FucU domain-containing protein [Bradyrhizobium sp. CB1650]|uniref:RbsD/FucU domain-containing protein n=1 Tax=Bradyrhizobium sp. CB1650 TaxID=3039153 RepID=UPI002435C212|nr:RbsD/FucU domain-containing protein [Bradyrhizobium sp. CB1650]WGD50904.1 RbsD/FucU domain-containing protein [Bradyrhizobium sp. CB1650]